MPETDPRAAFIAGLRKLVDLYETRPDLPVPCSPVRVGYAARDAAEFAQITRALGGRQDKNYDDEAIGLVAPAGEQFADAIKAGE